jgi:hypothetical protein
MNITNKNKNDNKKSDENNNNKEQNNELTEDLKYKINNILDRHKRHMKISAYIFVILFICFLVILLIDIYKVIQKNIVNNIYGIIILLSMYTSIHFFEYFIVSRKKDKIES